MAVMPSKFHRVPLCHPEDQRANEAAHETESARRVPCARDVFRSALDRHQQKGCSMTGTRMARGTLRQSCSVLVAA